jgi:hypothetical protein
MVVAVQHQCRAIGARNRVYARAVYAVWEVVGELELALTFSDSRFHGEDSGGFARRVFVVVARWK